MHRFTYFAIAAALTLPAAAADLPPEGVAPRAVSSAVIVATPAGDAPEPVFGETPDWQNTMRVQVGGLAFGDLDGNGLPDLALVNYQSNSFPPYEDWRNFVYFNEGGTLQAEPGWVSDDERHSGDAAIGDVDGDGFNDLVVANGGGGYAPNAVYFGSAEGLATTPGWLSEQPAWATSLELFDVDGDGDLDLLTTNQGAGQNDAYRPMYLFRSEGGALETVPSWQSSEASIQNDAAVGDLDGDGDLDIGAARWVNFESGLYENIDGTPATTPYWTTGSNIGDRGIEFADMDGDGDLDVVLGDGDVLIIHRNDGEDVFTHVWTSAQTSNHQDLLVADLDGDGLPDIVDIDFSTGRTYLYLNTAQWPDTIPSWSYDAPASGTALAAADVDGDGMLDLAIGYSGTPSAVVFLNQREPSVGDDLIFVDGFDGTPVVQCGWDTSLGNPGGALNAMALWNGELYVGGSPDGTLGGVNGGVARVDIGTGTFLPLGTAELVDGFVNDFVAFDDGDGDTLYVLGAFNGMRFGGVELPGSRAIVAWNGATLSTLDSPFAAAMAFAWTGVEYDDQLVVGGTLGVPQTPLLAFHDGETWTSYSSEFEGLTAPAIFASEVFDGDLYIGGRFDGIRLPDGNGGEMVSESKNVMGFDGEAFFNVGGGVERSGNSISQVLALKTFDDGNGAALYIGGRFNQSVSGTPMFAVAKWDGSTLSAVGAGFPVPTEVRGFEVYDDGSGPALYATGTFTADTMGTPIRRFAKLVDGAWVEVAGGTGENPGPILGLPDGTLAVGGSFTEVGTDGVPGSGPANGLANLACAME